MPAATATRVAILADDLIWAVRLADAVTAAGGVPVRVRTLPALSETDAAFVIVDLTARAYDGVEAVRAAAGRTARVLAVGQHDDVALRKAALAAGAEKVLAYRKLFEDGPAVLEAWLSATRP